MTVSWRDEFRRPVPILLAVLALVGWILAIVSWQQRSSVSQELDAERSAHAATRDELAEVEGLVGSRDELEQEVQASQEQRAQIEDELDMLRQQVAEERQVLEREQQDYQAASEAERARLEGELERAQAEVERLQALQTDRASEVERLEAELLPRREELGTFEARLDETERNLVERSQELVEVGERLEATRVQEAELQNRLAQLTADGAAAAQQALDAEERLQAAREAEAQLELELAAAREAFAQIEAQQAGLEEQVRVLAERRDALAVDTDAARDQRTALQQTLSELTATVAARGSDLDRLEQRMAELQAQEAALDRAVAYGIRPGQYQMGPIAALFTSGGSFEMMNTQTGATIEGTYSVEDGVLTLDDARGDLRWTRFPLVCRIEPEAIGFSLHEVDADMACGGLSGQLFERAS
jgi:septal ring factor EnvC (AmiA/AmiB activator)